MVSQWTSQLYLPTVYSLGVTLYVINMHSKTKFVNLYNGSITLPKKVQNKA